jgi:hypothetical protein
MGKVVGTLKINHIFSKIIRILAFLILAFGVLNQAAD